MNRRELILICLYEVILACLLSCGVGMIFHECDGENETIDAVEKGGGRTVVVPGGGRMQGPCEKGVFRF